MIEERKSILVVDDDWLVSFGLKRALQKESFHVATAETGAAAVAACHAFTFDLCLLDIHLPDVSGLELMKLILRKHPETRVVIMTASYNNPWDLSENILEAMGNGASHFITKPFNLDETKKFLIRLLEGGENSGPLPAFIGHGP